MKACWRKNANEKKSGAGQYFTPRPLIDSMVAVMKPTLEDVIQDPAAGTGGFLIAANHYLREHHDFDSLTEAQQRKYQTNTFFGMEHVQDTHRLALMNLMLHGIDGGIRYGDTLSPEGQALPRPTLNLSNPPFGTKKGGGLPTRDDFTYPTSNKQFCFVQHIYRGLAPGGRAAVVLPDNVLFESGVGKDIRKDLMEKCNLHTILRLPTGIFYAQGVKTNVLFFTRGQTDKGNTKEVWVYDLRANMPQFGKRTPLDPRSLQRVRNRLWHRSPRQPRSPEEAEGHWRHRTLPQIHPPVDHRARRQPRHRLAQRRQRRQRTLAARRAGGAGRAWPMQELKRPPFAELRGILEETGRRPRPAARGTARHRTRRRVEHTGLAPLRPRNDRHVFWQVVVESRDGDIAATLWATTAWVTKIAAFAEILDQIAAHERLGNGRLRELLIAARAPFCAPAGRCSMVAVMNERPVTAGRAAYYLGANHTGQRR
jgi:hypothetical protein